MTDFDPSDIAEYSRRINLVGKAFTPSQPVADTDLFAGRLEQLQSLVKVKAMGGQHAIIYGTRGAGKTSLARVAQQVVTPPDQARPYHVCTQGTTFDEIWRSVLRSIHLSNPVPGLGFNASPGTNVFDASVYLPDNPTPNDVVRVFESLASIVNPFVVIDEFDRPLKDDVRGAIADTIKILADKAIPVTLILVGVASSVEELLHEHASIQRSLAQVEMPPMNPMELQDIIDRGMRIAEMTIAPRVAEKIVKVSLGLPHYTHLLTLHAATVTLERGGTHVDDIAFQASLDLALKAASQSTREHYHSATFSNRETLYKEVLLACALAPRDEMGSFGAPEVREQLRKITGRQYEIPAFSTHLKDFSSTSGGRGGILERIGETRRFRYRFLDPLMPTYVLLNGQLENRS